MEAPPDSEVLLQPQPEYVFDQQVQWQGPSRRLVAQEMRSSPHPL